METPFVDKDYVLERFAGKGGWTYARIPEIAPDKHAHFGWVRVQGSIDGYPISKYHLMPMGNGQLFLPVKAAIRKAIGKQAGNTVHVVLYKDDLPVEIPAELDACLRDEPGALAAFNQLDEAGQVSMVKWVYAAKKEETIAERIAITIDALLQGKLPNKLKTKKLLG